ncbi:DUF499 domain-containing protein [Infirmifilum sp.]|jgi:predicted AAA+ superfamily ATPase|uniref:DUF499 domain-containing protein n=1 Tax=Infirmifilum sp. TaxID=2856575 RepID=UPI003D103EB1
MGLKSYARVRQDLYDESLDSQLAPSLAEVYLQRGHDLYRNSESFFAATYLSETIKRVLREVAETVAGRGKRNVFPLFSLYGGGKTHLLLTIIHAVRNPYALQKVDPELGALYSNARPRLVVLDGESDELCPNPSKPLGLGPYEVRTVWGSLAYQLGRYAELREEDEKVYAPGAVTLKKLLGEEPVVILIDEIAKYVTRFRESSDSSLKGYGNSVVSFIESLAKAVEGTKAALVITLPLEVKDGEEKYIEVYREAARMIRNGIGRVVSNYEMPLRPEETVEVLKRRIFEQVDAKVVGELRSKYLVLYQSEAKFFGNQAVQLAARLNVTAPFHPTYLDTLYDIVTRNPELQRTRDALRISRLVVRRILRSDEDPDFIMPWHIDVADETIRGFVLTQPFAYFEPVVNKDLFEKARELDPRGLVYRLALSIFLRTYVYGRLLIPENVFPGKEDIAFMVYEEGLARSLGIKPVDILNALNMAENELYYLRVRHERYWFNPVPSVREFCEDKTERVDPNKVRSKLLEAVNKLAVGGPPNAPRKAAESRLFEVIISEGPLPIDEPRYILVISPKNLSKEEIRKIIYEVKSGGGKVYRNTIAVLYPSDERKLEDLSMHAATIVACDEVEKQLEEIYPDEEYRNYERKALQRYRNKKWEELMYKILAAFDTIAFPSEQEVTEDRVSLRDTSLARGAEEALADPGLAKAKIDRLNFAELDFLIKKILGSSLAESDKELMVKDILTYFYTNPRLPFVKRDLVLEALKEGIENLKIGLQRGGEIYWLRIYKQGEAVGLPVGRVPDSVYESDIVLPWRKAASRMLESLKPRVVEEQGRKVRVSYVFREKNRETPLIDLDKEKAIEMFLSYPVVEKIEEIRHEVLVDVVPSRVEVLPGGEVSVEITIQPIGSIERPVALHVDRGVVDPSSGLLPLKTRWSITAPEAEGEYSYTVRVESPELEQPAIARLTVSVRTERTPIINKLLVEDLEEFEDLVRSKELGPLVLEKGVIRLERDSEHFELSARGSDPLVFLELAKELKRSTGIHAVKEFSAEVVLTKPIDVKGDVNSILSKYRGVKAL